MRQILLLYGFLMAWTSPMLGWTQSGIRSVQAHLTVKKWEKGQTVTYEADLYYQANGKLVSRFAPPLNYVLINDAEGHIQLYHPEKKQVKTFHEPWMGSQTTYFYCFAHRKMADLGLSGYGFTLTHSSYEAPYQITWWVPPADLSKQLTKIKLVHQQGKIVFAGYYHPEEGEFKKVWYTGGQWEAGAFFPAKITTITYIDAGQDSIVEQSQFRDFQFNAHPLPAEFSFEIPDDAHHLD